MKKLLLSALFVILAMLPNSLSAQNKSSEKIVQGSWMGTLSAGGMDLRVVFNLKLAGNDSITATLDSPDQNAKDIPCESVSLDNKKIVIKAPVINGEYSGTITGDSTIVGTWSQNGGSFPLELKKQRTQADVNKTK